MAGWGSEKRQEAGQLPGEIVTGNIQAGLTASRKPLSRLSCDIGSNRAID